MSPVLRRLLSRNLLILVPALLAAACGTLEVGIQRAGPLPTEPSASTPAQTQLQPTGTSDAGGKLGGTTPQAAIPRPTLQPPAITTLAVAPDGAVWYGFGHLSCCPPQGGGGAVRRSGEEITPFGLTDGLPDENVQVLKVAPDGEVWAGAGRHVLRFDGRSWQTVDQVGRYVISIVLDIAFTADGAAWIASPYELLRFDGRGCTVYGAMLHTLAVGPEGSIWAAGWQGLQDSAFVGSFDGTEWTTYNTIELFEEAVGRIVVTADGRVWGSTLRHGVVSLDGDEWKEYTTADGLPSNQIIDLAVAPDGVLWAVTDYGVAYFDGQEWRSLDDAPDWITRIAFASDGTAWFGTSTGQVLPYEPALEFGPNVTPSSVASAKEAQALSSEAGTTATKPSDVAPLP